MGNERNEYLELADWRRQVAALWEAWRRESVADPTAATARFRTAKDALFRDHLQSPLPAEERAGFAGIPYWPYDPAYRMTVRLQPPDGDGGPHGAGSSDADAVDDDGSVSALPAIALPSSGHGSIPFRRVGRVELSGPLVGHSLSVFWIEGYGGGLFLPFRDATSARETYGAGRYLLDTIKSADHGGAWHTNELVLDFNLSYHPSCAYDPRWSCPLAPPENRLSLPVRVGERVRG